MCGAERMRKTSYKATIVAADSYMATSLPHSHLLLSLDGSFPEPIILNSTLPESKEKAHAVPNFVSSWPLQMHARTLVSLSDRIVNASHPVIMHQTRP